MAAVRVNVENITLFEDGDSRRFREYFALPDIAEGFLLLQGRDAHSTAEVECLFEKGCSLKELDGIGKAVGWEWVNGEKRDIVADDVLRRDPERRA